MRAVLMRVVRSVAFEILAFEMLALGAGALFVGAVIHSSVPSVRLRFFVLLEPAPPDAPVPPALFRAFVPALFRAFVPALFRAFVPVLLGVVVLVPAPPGGAPPGAELVPTVLPVGAVVPAVRAHAGASMATRSAAMPREPYAFTEPSDMPSVSATWASVMSAK
ncbi:hypothetical protein SAMN04487980_102593 [Streptomyces sp. cf124]|nr:hypothetical protein SAMN04487980_102593 [Streptomyces sp. cf124]